MQNQNIEAKPENTVRKIVNALDLCHCANTDILTKISEHAEYVTLIEKNPPILELIGKKINGQRKDRRNRSESVPEDCEINEGMAFSLHDLMEKPVAQTEKTKTVFAASFEPVACKDPRITHKSKGAGPEIDIQNANKLLKIGKKIVDTKKTNGKPVSKEQRNAGQILWEWKEPETNNKVETKRAVKKDKPHYEGGIISLFKAMQSEPIDRTVIEESGMPVATQFEFPLLHHPISIRMTLPETVIVEKGKIAIGKDVVLTDLPENLDVSQGIDGKFFMNLVSTKSKSEKFAKFTIRLKYIGCLNGHQVYTPKVDTQEIIPAKGTIHTSRTVNGEILHLLPIAMPAE